MPKFLAPEFSSVQAPVGKPTLRTSRHIINGSDEQTPFLGFNEHYSMQVLARLGVARVAKTTMSDDGRVLVVDRFDVDEQGEPAFGVEDACSLLGLPRMKSTVHHREMVEALCDAAVSTGKDIVAAAKNETRWQSIAKQMLHAWNEGMASLRSAKPQVALRALTPIIEAAGFSDADKADNGRKVIGRSEMRVNRGKGM